ncbi:hypothetical protein [Actinomadura sp. WMMB 499]|uniref:hypothetical protein n=1 Tax=Actinomadura sp. WMMB 499 TaxID=1219491 RepID=UPI0012482C25|nr:hypothetical protein [Actinomadura sp. WMMB 499]QFG23133.1 hypothetical protein F7P10_20405 [Actinomadura sp. WMMB 499]
MGSWVYVRGWLDFYGQENEARRMLADVPGWAFPEGGWARAACYGRAVRAGHLDELLDRVRAVAALPAVDADGDRVCGFFIAFHEEDGQFEWQVRDGEVFVSRAPARFDYLWR